MRPSVSLGGDGEGRSRRVAGGLSDGGQASVERIVPVACRAVDAAHVRVDKTPDGFRERFENGRQLARAFADNSQDLANARLLIQRVREFPVALLKLVEHPRVFPFEFGYPRAELVVAWDARRAMLFPWSRRFGANPTPSLG